MPSSLQARITRSAISPRLAISTFSNISNCRASASACRLNNPPWQAMRLPYNLRFARSSSNFEEYLTELHGLSIFGHHFGNYTARFCLDFIHDFHRFDYANDHVLGDGFSDINKWTTFR